MPQGRMFTVKFCCRKCRNTNHYDGTSSIKVVSNETLFKFLQKPNSSLLVSDLSLAGQSESVFLIIYSSEMALPFVLNMKSL